MADAPLKTSVVVDVASEARSRRIPRSSYLAWCVLAVASLVGASALLRPGWMRPTAPGAAVAERPGASLMSESGTLARRALTPNVVPVAVRDPEDIDVVLRRLRPEAGESFSGLLHAAHLYGPDVEAAGPAGKPAVRVLDLITDERRAREQFGGGRVLARTRYGLRFPLVYEWALSIDQSNTESHPGQGLATLATLGMPLQSQISVAGEELHLEDVLNDLVANFTLEGEIYWDATALMLYLPPSRTWCNKFGARFSFDDLAAELMRRPADESACAGTHKLIALAILMRVDAESPLLDLRRREELRGFLAGVVNQLRRAELADGGWSFLWSRERRDRAARTAPPDPVIHATGHHLEWLMLLPAELQPEREIVVRAVERCLQLLRGRLDDPGWAREHYCPAIHAARSVCLWTGTGTGAGAGPSGPIPREGASR